MESRGTIESPAKPFTIGTVSGAREVSTSFATVDDAEEDYDDEEEEEEELEPKLKYERLGNDLSQILSKDAASALAVHPKFCALGTHWGVIHILDPQGNNIVAKEINAHTTTVNQIAIDASGDHIASCSDDGRVVITGMYNSEGNRYVNLDRPVKAVALDPAYSKPGTSRRYVSGDDKLVLNEKGIFSTNRQFVLHQGEGPIRNIKWRGDLIAWANDLGVKIYDVSAKERITFIARDHSPDLRPELYRCNMCWKNNITLLIGWGDTVKVCEIRERPRSEMEKRENRDLPQRYVAIVALFTVEFYVCGIAPLNDNCIVLLTYEDKETQMEAGQQVSSRPHIRVLQLVNDGFEPFEEISNDALSIRGFQEYRCNDYHLEYVAEDVLYYIVSPKDVVLAKLRDHDDHVDWLLAQEKYERALEVVQEHYKDLKRHTFQDISRDFIKYLIDKSNFESAALQCSKSLKSRQEWEEHFFVFANYMKLKIIAPYLPKGGNRLGPAIYEMVLNEFLQTDASAFAEYLKDWPADHYNISTIINSILDKLDRMEKDPNNTVLLECLALLYTKESRFDKALDTYLSLQNPQAFILIQKHNLLAAILDINNKIIELMELDREKALKMLMDSLGKIPVLKVIDQLRRRRDLYFAFLERLNRKDPLNQLKLLRTEHYNDLVELFAEFDQSKLLQYLKSTTHYDLTKSAKLCFEMDFIDETIYLYGRMGNLKHALELIINNLKDVEKAIDFCKEHDDRDLWDDLVDHAIDKPRFVVGLLQNIGTHTNPLSIIQRIKEGMRIEGLQPALVKILQDYNLQISLLQGCQKILVNDSFNLFQRHVKTQKKGISVSELNFCQVCHHPMVDFGNDDDYGRSRSRTLSTSSSNYGVTTGPGLGGLDDMAVFNCGHTFHAACLDGAESCVVCANQKTPASHLLRGV